MGELIQWFFNKDQSIAAMFVVMGVCGAVVAAVSRWIWARHIAPTLDHMAENIARLALEWTPNGGSSAMDKLNGIALNHEDAQRHWKALELASDAVGRQIEAMNRRLDAQDVGIARIEASLKDNEDQGR